jgi:transposase
MKARIQAGAQLDALILTAPEEVRGPLRTLTSRQRIQACAVLRPGLSPARPPPRKPRCVPWPAAGRRCWPRSMTWTPSSPRWSPPPRTPRSARHRRGHRRAAAGHRGGQRGPAALGASFARLCGAAPVPVSSGRTDRHRLHRGGDRQANSALWRIALVRMGCHQPTKDYVVRRTAEGKTKTEITRCLKRYIAREVFPLLVA